jgi:integration host factor subunit beta
MGETPVPVGRKRKNMATVTKKELVDRIAEQLGVKRVIVKRVTQQFLDEIIAELGRGNRLEFRDFGVFECKQRAARVAQNPKTMERVTVPSKRTVKFKVGRLMKLKMQEIAAKTQAGRDGQAAPAPAAKA